MDASSKSSFARAWVRLCLRGARTILCQGRAWQRFAVDVLGYQVEDAPIVPNWTATPTLLAIGRSRRSSTADRLVRLLFLGWVDREKGVFELIDACRRLAESNRFELNIVGEGNASDAVRDVVAQNSLGSFVRFSGWLKGPELERALAEADVLVLPSWSEGLPNAMIEAMAARLAVVVTAVGNIPDVVTDGRETILVPPRDVVALKLALKKVIDEPDFRRQLGDAAFELAEREFSVEPAVDRILMAVGNSVSRFGSNRRKQSVGI